MELFCKCLLVCKFICLSDNKMFSSLVQVAPAESETNRRQLGDWSVMRSLSNGPSIPVPRSLAQWRHLAHPVFQFHGTWRSGATWRNALLIARENIPCIVFRNDTYPHVTRFFFLVVQSLKKHPTLMESADKKNECVNFKKHIYLSETTWCGEP